MRKIIVKKERNKYIVIKENGELIDSYTEKISAIGGAVNFAKNQNEEVKVEIKADV